MIKKETSVIIRTFNEERHVRGLFDSLEARENALRLLNATRDGDGVKIFIGAENNLFASTGCSLVIAPYRNNIMFYMSWLNY